MEYTLFLVSLILFFVILFTLIVLNVKKTVKKHKSKKNGVVLKHDTRFTSNKDEYKNDPVSNNKKVDSLINNNSTLKTANITFNEKDLVLSLNKTYIVGVKNVIKPGKYDLLSVSEKVTSFGLRINGIRNTYEHGSVYVFAEGDIISPTTQNVILR